MSTNLSMDELSNILGKMANASATQGGEVIRDGIYLFLVRDYLVRKLNDGTFFIVELKVLKSAPKEPGVMPNPPGTTCSLVMNLSTNKSALGNMKNFTLSLLGYAGQDVNPADLAAVAQKLTVERLARGMLIGDETFRKPIKSGANAGKPFTGHRWAHVQQSPQEIQARRAELDAEGSSAETATA